MTVEELLRVVPEYLDLLIMEENPSECLYKGEKRDLVGAQRKLLEPRTLERVSSFSNPCGAVHGFLIIVVRKV